MPEHETSTAERPFSHRLTWQDSDVDIPFPKCVLTRNSHSEGIESHRQLQCKSRHTGGHLKTRESPFSNSIPKVEKKAHFSLSRTATNVRAAL